MVLVKAVTDRQRLTIVDGDNQTSVMPEVDDQPLQVIMDRPDGEPDLFQRHVSVETSVPYPDRGQAFVTCSLERASASRSLR